MSDELRHECGIAALYQLAESEAPSGPADEAVRDGNVARLVPQLLLDLQNRGQLAAGLSSYNPDRPRVLETYKDVGTVSEAFRMSHLEEHARILEQCAGAAAIGHTRYATCGGDDIRHAQPFERHHGRLWKWFSFAFNGNLANFTDLRDRMLKRRDYHFSLNTDTEMLMHSLAYGMRGEKPPKLQDVIGSICESFDGPYNLVFLDAAGRMMIVRDPLGFRPLSWAVQGRLFAAASESVALQNLGFTDIRDLQPGEMIVIDKGRMRIHRFGAAPRPARCFFEWVYFSNVASSIDGSSVYLARARSGRRLAEMEDREVDGESIVVPVPDTAKAAADAYAYEMGVPSVEGLIRNRYVGRTFIQPNSTRGRSAKNKYTALPDVLAGKRVFLVEDSIVRSTTLRTLVEQIRGRGGAREIHVRVACPPIVAPCFYGIDMSTLSELFAPEFVRRGYRGDPSSGMLARMAEALKVDSLRYLGASDMGACLAQPDESLCKGCITGKYPTDWGNKLIRRARRRLREGKCQRTYE